MNNCQQWNIETNQSGAKRHYQSPVMDSHLQIQTNPIKCQRCNPEAESEAEKSKRTNFAFWNFSTIICFLSEISCTKWVKEIGCIIYIKLLPGTTCAFWCQGHRPKGNENWMSSEDFNWHKVWNLSINGYEFGKDKIMEDKFCETKKSMEVCCWVLLWLASISVLIRLWAGSGKMFNFFFFKDEW